MTQRTLAWTFFCIAALLTRPLAAAEVVDATHGRWTHSADTAADGKLLLTRPGRNITAAYLADDPDRQPLVVEFNQDATLVTVQLARQSVGRVVLEIAEETTQFPTGRIVLTALDAKVHGRTAQLESNPGNHRIGFWTDPDDTVGWTYPATRWGMYDVDLTYSVDSGAGNLVEITIGSESLNCELKETGSWYRYTTIPVGRVYVPEAGPLEVQVAGRQVNGAALMNLKAVTLRPAPEGELAVQADDKTVELDARAATVHGVTLRYEPNPKKRCLGYWSNPADWASWDFQIDAPGTFQVELTQGCGTGHGGSDVDVLVGTQKLAFRVDDTGGFQNWKPRAIGTVQIATAGRHRLEVRPRNKQRAAVMDIRRIRLLPVNK